MVVHMNSQTKCRRYSELISFDTFEERLEYLKLDGSVGKDTFGFDRYLNQYFYKLPEWKKARSIVILRDNGCDLGIDGLPIYGKVIIHHMNAITQKDIIDRSPDLFNPEYLITVSHNTHNTIHYGNPSNNEVADRTENDTCPWRNHVI